MNIRPLVALALVGAAAALVGCPGGAMVPLPSTSMSPGASTAPTTTPTAPASPGVSAKAGAASDAYMKAVDAVKQAGYSAWTLYRIEGRNMGANGIANAQGQTWNVFIYTPSDQKSWQVAVVPGIGASPSTVTQADLMYVAGYDLNPSMWKVDSDAAVTAAGGSTSGTMWLYSPAQFRAVRSKTSNDPVWAINAGGAGTVDVNANTGAKL